MSTGGFDEHDVSPCINFEQAKAEAGAAPEAAAAPIGRQFPERVARHETGLGDVVGERQAVQQPRERRRLRRALLRPHGVSVHKVARWL